MAIFLLSACLLLIVVSVITAKLWTARPVAPAENDAEWEVLRAKRDEIEQDAVLLPQTKEELRAEWAQTAEAVMSRANDGASSRNAGRPHSWMLAAGVLILAMAVYAMTGSWEGQALSWNWQTLPQSESSFEPAPAAGAPHPGSTETLEKRISDLEEKLQKTPDDVGGWVLLARSRGIQRDFVKSAVALERALALAPGHPDLLATLADTLAMTANGSLAGKPTQLLDEALKAEPTHRKSLTLAATAALQQDNPGKAADYLRRLRTSLPGDSPDIAKIDEAIATLSSAASASPTGKKEAGARAPASGATLAAIEGQVTLAPALIADLKKRGLPESAMLFVLARDPSGPPMPVAALRLPVQKLVEGGAVAFKLDDSQAMMPTHKLSSKAQVDVEARISMSGTAGKQPGDLSVIARSIKPAAGEKLSLVIQPAP